MKTMHRIFMSDEYVAEAQRLSIAQNKMLKFVYQTWWSWWLPRAAMAALIIWLIVNGFDWSLTAWLVAFIALSLFAEWLGKRNLVKRRKKLISDSSIIVSMDENGVDVVAENSNSHSKWAGMLPPLVYPHGVLIKFSRLSGIWLPDQALIEGSPDDVRKLLAENVKDSGPGRK